MQAVGRGSVEVVDIVVAWTLLPLLLDTLLDVVIFSMLLVVVVASLELDDVGRATEDSLEIVVLEVELKVERVDVCIIVMTVFEVELNEIVVVVVGTG